MLVSLEAATLPATGKSVRSRTPHGKILKRSSRRQMILAQSEINDKARRGAWWSRREQRGSHPFQHSVIWYHHHTAFARISAIRHIGGAYRPRTSSKGIRRNSPFPPSSHPPPSPNLDSSTPSFPLPSRPSGPPASSQTPSPASASPTRHLLLYPPASHSQHSMEAPRIFLRVERRL
jgi:hypothetical protein